MTDACCDFIVTDLTVRGRTYTAACLYEGKHLTDLRLEKKDTVSRTGQIVVGVVENIAANIGGAFVRIGRDERAFLPDRRPSVRGSSRLIVRLTKDAFGIKQCTCTDKLEIAGRYCVAVEDRKGFSFSSKLDKATKEQLKARLNPSLAETCGILIRTAAATAALTDIEKEIRTLSEHLRLVRERAAGAPVGTILYQPEPFYVRMINDMRRKPDRIRSDIPLAAKLTGGDYYEDPTISLSVLKGLESDIGKLTQRRVWLRSGAFLIFDRTEALTDIDVNTGKCEKGRRAADTYRTVNDEALDEIARQIRLRNLSGMILVDFLKMPDRQSEAALLEKARALFRQESYHTEAVDITRLGLMEIIREKREPALEDILRD